MPLGDCEVPAEIVLYKVLPGFWLSSTLNLRGAVVGPTELPSAVCSGWVSVQCFCPVPCAQSPWAEQGGGVHLLLVEASQNHGASKQQLGWVYCRVFGFQVMWPLRDLGLWRFPAPS